MNVPNGPNQNRQTHHCPPRREQQATTIKLSIRRSVESSQMVKEHTAFFLVGRLVPALAVGSLAYAALRLNLVGEGG